MKKISFIAILFFVTIILYIFFVSLNSKKVYDTSELIGKPISKIDLNLLNKNRKFNTEDFSKNNFTLINFFSSWCGPCRKEHKFLMQLSKNKDMKIFGINFKDKKSNANEFLNKLGNPYYLIAADSTGKKSISFGVYGIPETILINKDLIIVKKYIGPIDQNDVKEILKEIK